MAIYQGVPLPISRKLIRPWRLIARRTPSSRNPNTVVWKTARTSALVLAALLATGPVTATDRLMERQLAAALAEAPGQVVRLDVAGERVFALYTETLQKKPAGGVLLLHDRSAHPDWPTVIAPLRRELPHHGWATLAIQMPVVRGEAGLDEYARVFNESPARIRAGIAYLKQQGSTPVVLIGHGFGANMAAAYLAQGNDGDVEGLAGIGMRGLEHRDPRLDAAVALADIGIPVLDLFGETDLADVLAGAPRRLDAAHRAGNRFSLPPPQGLTTKVQTLLMRRSGNPAYRQEAVAGADHGFTDNPGQLVEHVRGWLKTYVERAGRPLQE